MQSRIALIIALLLVLCSDAWAPMGHGILPAPIVPGGLFMPAYDNVSANWTKAGLALIGGIPNRTTQCGATVNPSGLTPPVANDDAANINAAITACPVGQVVQLGAGVFQLDQTEHIRVNQQITLRGTGNCANSSFPYCSSVIQYINGAWPTYNATECGTTTGVPPSGTAPGSFVACTIGGEALVILGLSPGNIYGWGATSGATNCQINNAVTSTVPCGTSLAADAHQGDVKVQVADNSNFAPGDWVLIDDYPTYTTQTNPLFTQWTVNGSVGSQPSTTVLATPDEFRSTPTPVTPHTENADVSDCDGYSMCNGRFNEEMHLVSAVGAGPCPGVNCTITFDSPLTMDKRHGGSFDGRVYWLTGCGCGSGPSPPTRQPILQQASLENVSLARGYASNLEIELCVYCWTLNVDTGYWINGANVDYSARVQLERSFFHNCIDCVNNGNEYPVGINAASTEILLENSILLFGGKGMVGRVATGSVVAYNYADKHFYEQGTIPADWLLDMDINGSHEGGTHHFLMEGNWTSSCDGDNTHGAAAYHTFFRNDCNGFRTNFIDPSNVSLSVSDIINQCFNGTGTHNDCGRLRGAGPMSFNYWYSYVGNVMGMAGQSTAGNGWIYSSDTPGNRGLNSTHPMTDRAIWQSGWTGQDPQTCCEYVSDPNLDGTNNNPWVFKNGNYDYVTGTVADNATGFSQTFPNSLYLSAKPAFFSAGSCTYPWPWITPTTGPFVQPNTGGAGCGGSGLPAKARWDAGTPFVQP